MKCCRRRVRYALRIRRLCRHALREHGSPGRFAAAVALGAFLATSPIPPVLWMRTITGTAIASVARLNRLTTAFVVNVPVGPIAFAIIALEVELGALVLGRPAPRWPDPGADRARAFLREAGAAFGQWCVGAAVVAPLTALVAGVVAYRIAVARGRPARG